MKNVVKKIVSPEPRYRSQCRCEHVALNDYKSDKYCRWRNERYGKGKEPAHLCRHYARYYIDGKKYCARHAGMVAIKILEELTL